jgi:hypothetical protein
MGRNRFRASHPGRIYAFTPAPRETVTEQIVTMRNTKLLFIALITVGAACAPAAAQDDAALIGTYTQKHACKGDGSDTPKDIVKITDTMADSNFGPCTFGSDKAWSGKTLKATSTCKQKTGGEYDVKLSFTMKDDKTVDFLEEGSQYKSVLYRCEGAK